MIITLIIFAIIGLIKIISTILIIGISLVHFNNINFEGVKRISIFDKTLEEDCYIIPSISYRLSKKYFDISFKWLTFNYYSCYTMEKEE